MSSGQLATRKLSAPHRRMLATVRLMADAHKERVGAAIRERREELDLSVEALAGKIPVAEKTLRRWEKGESFGHMDNLEKLAEELQTTVDKLMAGPSASGDTNGATPDLGAALNGDQPDDLHQQLADLHRKLDRLLDFFGLADDKTDLATALYDFAEAIRRGPLEPHEAEETATGS